MNILITGGNGFVGTNLTQDFINLDYRVDILDITPPTVVGVSNSYFWNNISTVDFDKYHAIIHLAGKAHDTRGTAQREEYFAINTELTKIIFDRFQASAAKVFINFSSVKAVADKVQSGILTEDCTPVPIGPYAESKLKAEEYILENINKTFDKKVYILRPSMIHGPGNKGNLNLLYAVVKNGFPWPLGDFDNQRSFTSIDNLSFILLKLVEGDVQSGIYNVSDDEPVSTNDLIAVISEAIGKKIKILNISQRIITTFAKMGDTLKLPFNTFRLEKLTENYVVSNHKIKNAIGIEQLPVESKKGLLITIKSFNKNV